MKMGMIDLCTFPAAPCLVAQRLTAQNAGIHHPKISMSKKIFNMLYITGKRLLISHQGAVTPIDAVLAAVNLVIVRLSCFNLTWR